MADGDRESAAHLRKQIELDEEMIRDHESGLHVHDPDFIERVKEKLPHLRRCAEAFEARADDNQR